MASSAYIISAAALRPSIADLQLAIVGVRFFGLARGVFRYLERYTSHQVTFRILAQLRHRILSSPGAPGSGAFIGLLGRRLARPGHRRYC